MIGKWDTLQQCIIKVIKVIYPTTDCEYISRTMDGWYEDRRDLHSCIKFLCIYFKTLENVHHIQYKK